VFNTKSNKARASFEVLLIGNVFNKVWREDGGFF
jgi:hypothetical protein